MHRENNMKITKKNILPAKNMLIFTRLDDWVKLSKEGVLKVLTGSCVPPQPVGRREIEICILSIRIGAG